MKKLFFIPCLLIILFGCGNNAEVKQKAENARAMAAPPKPTDISMNMSKSAARDKGARDATKPQPNTQDVSKKIIKEGEISFETKNILNTRNAIYNSLQKLGGYIAEETESNDSADTRKQYVLKARIPEKSFEAFLNGVSSNAVKIDSKNIRAKDVSTEYIDITTQLANKKKLEDRYVELLKKGSKIADLLEIEDKITEIQTDIESTEAQLNFLTKQVEYSSLDITFYTQPAIKDIGQTFSVKVVSALAGGWDILISIFLGLIALWPVWIIVTAGYFVVKAWGKRYPSKMANP